MQTAHLTAALACAIAITMAAPAHAYIGPGAGAGTIIVTIGILAAVVMAFFAILWYPLKRAMKKRRSDSDGPGPKA